MKAILQNFRTGAMNVADVPPPTAKPGGVLVHNVASLVSAGTEKAIIELARMNPLQKAKARPDLVKKVLNRAAQEGLLGTAKIVMNLVSAPRPLGYSCAGIVRTVGAGVTDLQPGDRVACAGIGYANHAEVVFVPRNLCVPIPEGVDFHDAAFVTLGAIAMQGVRQADLRVGENVVVLGLGLVGQITAQICVASGCRVFGSDLDPAKVKLALQLGAQAGQAGDVVAAVREFTRGRGADAILITAATPSSEPVALAAELARDRARVVAVGDVGLHLQRRAYYEKELDLRLSRSYGPGRYDPSYEEKGTDYPIGYVRWTENRNMESFLDLVGQGRVRIAPLVTHRFPIEQAEHAYGLLTGETKEPYIGILLEYDAEREQPSTIELKPVDAVKGDGVRFGIIGAGQFAQGILLPRLKKVPGVTITGIATGSGLTSRGVAEKYGCQFCTSDHKELLARADIDAVLIATRHNLHAPMVAEALAAGKHVFVEKPLAIDDAQLRQVEQAFKGDRVLTVGFNRRFSPLAVELKSAFPEKPVAITYRVNAGAVAGSSWVQDPAEGGGRIVGEVCHFVDLLQFLADAAPVEVVAWALGERSESPSDPDNVSIQIRFANGSLGTILYVANGDPGFPKERVEVFGGGAVGVIDNWRDLKIRRHGKTSGRKPFLAAEKGFEEELAAFVQSCRQGGALPIPFAGLVQTSRATFAIQESLRSGQPVAIG